MTYFFRCDGRYACLDSSDEANCTSVCSENEFRCVNGVDVLNGNTCIWSYHVCDKIADCSDGSDEFNCNYTCPKQGSFACHNGTIYENEGKKYTVISKLNKNDC